jgi:hypothetical protein
MSLYDNLLKPAKPRQWVALISTGPTIVLISIMYSIFSGNLFYLFIIPAFILLNILMPPVTNCHICKKPLIKRVDGLIEHHIQCGCIEHRWRPVWHSWFEKLRSMILK